MRGKAMTFKKAVKHEAKARVAIAGPAGSGKTWTALTWAHALANGGTVALIDTERGSASKYADIFPEFDVLELDSFHPNNFIQGIKDAEQGGYSVLVIDSLSHAWNGTGGLLDLVDSIAKRKYQGNSFAAWKDATPLQNALIDALTGSPLHIIVTMRSKQEYIMEEKNGKSAPKKVGMAPIQRDGMEYEFDVVVDMDLDNTAIVQKSRCPALSGVIIAKPDGKVMDTLKSWLSGAPAPAAESAKPAQSSGLAQLLQRAKSRAFALGLASTKEEWESVLQEATGETLHDEDVTIALIGKVNGHLTKIEQQRKVS